MIEAPPLTARAVEDVLLAAPGLRRACVQLAPTADGRGYTEAGLAAGWLVWHSAPILVHFHADSARHAHQGLDCCRRALRAAGLRLRRCWDPDEEEYLAVLGWEEGRPDA